ncbi:protein IQ-DOMAIN 31-like [Tasmannia lanceolata]|uniref:protein IQ-DOMAIN 31-like n=1 Tax=Tasmannia lanceolata TaxID=3420 RepID=UPI0040640394
MGKSPGKWLKTLLFGKKSSRSSGLKGREALKAVSERETWITGKGPSDELAVDSPLISEPVSASTDKNGWKESEKGLSSSVPYDGEVLLPASQNAENQGTVGSHAFNDMEKFREEKAAIKAQAAFRGYLARRAFRALRGIIRLQALVRGHLVRRQAVATLRCFQRIVKLQALFRARRVRRSDLGLGGAKPSDSLLVNVSSQIEKLLANVFFIKLLAASPNAMPLVVQYGQAEPNSAWNWLERWTSRCSREPLSQPKRFIGSKSKTKQDTFQTVENESTGRSKRSLRRNTTPNMESGSTTYFTSEAEKPKRNVRKVSSNPLNSLQEPPQIDLEKVKRSLRKVSNSATDASDPIEVEPEKPKRSLRKVSDSPTDVPDQVIGEFAEVRKDTTVVSENNPNLEVATKPVVADGPVDMLDNDNLTVELHPLESIEKDGNISLMNGDLSSKEDQACHENQKGGRRRASLPMKPEYSENGLQNIPTLPSYMAATESAKAKLRGLGSPRFGSDGAEKNGYTRRHSLPTSTNGKVTSPSARTQKLFQASGKGGIRGDRLLLSSRDGNEKVVQAEWRR